ncbi:MAG: GNAT family N-acetyltransferase [Roseiflexaceae bacterium]
MEALFRVAGVSDTPTLIQLMREYYAFDHLPFDEAAARPALEALLDNGSFGRAWLIEDGGAAIGYVVLTLGYSLEYHGRDAFIDELYIREGYRGRGIGRQALALLEATCRELGVQALHLEVERSNPVAQEVYRRAGYKDENRYLMTKWII